MAGTTTGAGRRGAPRRLAAVAVAGLAIGAAALGACSSEQAENCTEQSGATFCVMRKGKSQVDPTATGLQPGSAFSAHLVGSAPAVGDQQPPLTAGPDGSAGGLALGVLGLTDPGLPAGSQVEFTATAADGTPVTVTVEVPG